MKYASIVNNYCKYVESVLFKLPNLIICFAKVYQIIKTKTYKTLIHLETVTMFRLNRSDRIGLRANYS